MASNLTVDTIRNSSGNTVLMQDGARQYISGEQIQMKYFQYTDTTTQAISADTSTVIGHMEVKITPKFANSQILLQHFAAGWHYNAGSPQSRGIRIKRNGTVIMTNDGQGYTDNGNWTTMSWVTAFFDTTHNSTSGLEYRIEINGNRARYNDHAGILNTATFIAMEIAQ